MEQETLTRRTDKLPTKIIRGSGVMKIVIALVLLVVGSLLFHWLSPWWFTP